MLASENSGRFYSIRVGLRDFLMAAVLVGFFNAQYIRLLRELDRDGFLASVASTFGISLIVWFALYAVLKILSGTENERLSLLDGVVLSFSFLLFLSPVTGLSALGLSGLGVYYSLFGSQIRLRRAMRLLVALTVALMWGRLTFSFLMPYILKADTALVSLLTGLETYSNIIVASDGVTLLQVGAGCSSFLNLTNAFLGWISAIVYMDVKVNLKRISYLIIIIVVVLIVNTVRIGLIGWEPQYYWLFHGAIGSNVANIMQTAAIFYFSYLAVRESK